MSTNIFINRQSLISSDMCFPGFEKEGHKLPSIFLHFVISITTKAELLQEGIIFLIHLFARAILLVKKLKIEETKAT